MDPVPLTRMGRDWKDRVTGMRALLEALYVRMNPRNFVVGLSRPTPYSNLVEKIYREESGLASRDA